MAESPQINPITTSLNVVQGEVKTITISASVTDGGILSYQWYASSANDHNGTLISGSTSSTFTIPTSAIETKYYYCEVTNTLNNTTETALSANMEVKVKSVENYLNGLINDKTALASALNDLGITASDSETFDTLVYKVRLATNTLPVASADTLGCVKIGENLAIDGNGVLSATFTGVQVVSCTQAEYDALVTAGTVDDNILYIIKD